MSRCLAGSSKFAIKEPAIERRCVEDLYSDLVKLKLRVDELERSVKTLHNAIVDRDKMLINLEGCVAYLINSNKLKA